MDSHHRALIAASAHAFVIGRKVAGVYDHAADRHRRVAAESRGQQLQGLDGDRGARFGGILPQIYDESEQRYFALAIEGTTVRGYDRAGDSFFEGRVEERVVQIYDHSEAAWFAYDIQAI